LLWPSYRAVKHGSLCVWIQIFMHNNFDGALVSRVAVHRYHKQANVQH